MITPLKEIIFPFSACVLTLSVLSFFSCTKSFPDVSLGAPLTVHGQHAFSRSCRRRLLSGDPSPLPEMDFGRDLP